MNSNASIEQVRKFIQKMNNNPSYLEQLFKDKKLEPNFVYSDGEYHNTPLFHIVAERYDYSNIESVIKLFIKYGVNINIKYRDKTALDYYYNPFKGEYPNIEVKYTKEMKKQTFSVMKLLIDNGAMLTGANIDDKLIHILTTCFRFSGLELAKSIIARFPHLKDILISDIIILSQDDLKILTNMGFKFDRKNVTDTIGEYTLLKLLSNGSFGIVFLCEKNNKEYVIKIMSDRTINRNISRQFAKDIYEVEVEKFGWIADQSLKDNKCEFLPCMNDHFISKLGNEQLYCVVMDYIKGFTLEDLIKCANQTGYKFDVVTVKKFLMYILRGLEFLKRKGLHHNDLHFQNIMFTNNKLIIVDVGRIENKILPKVNDITLFFKYMRMIPCQDINLVKNLEESIKGMKKTNAENQLVIIDFLKKQIDLEPSADDSLQVSITDDTVNLSPDSNSDICDNSTKEKKCIIASNLPLLDYQKRVCYAFETRRGLIAVHSVGSGKTLTAVTASQCFLEDNPKSLVYVITPSGLIENFKKELETYGISRIDKRYVFYSHKKFVLDYSNGVLPVDVFENNMVIIDEAHNFRTSIPTTLPHFQGPNVVAETDPSTYKVEEEKILKKIENLNKQQERVLKLERELEKKPNNDYIIRRFQSKIDKLIKTISKSLVQKYQKDKISKGFIEMYKSIFNIDDAVLVRDKKHFPGSYYMVEACMYAKRVLCLTATAIVNSLDDLTNLLSMVRGERLYRENFNKEQLIEWSNGYFSFYERDKHDVRYPSYTIYNVNITMPPAYFQEYIKIMSGKLEQAYKLNINTSPEFFTAHRFASNKLDDRFESPKVLWAVNKILDIVGKGGKVVLFSAYLESGVRFIKKHLEQIGIASNLITGEISKGDRIKVVQDYNSGNVPVLLITKAGGEGLDLKETTAFIMMEPSWNYATEVQAIGRTVRNGSHIKLPIDKRHVDCYLLFMDTPSDQSNYNRYGKTYQSGDEILYKYVLSKINLAKDAYYEISKSSIENKVFKQWSPDRKFIKI